LENINKTDGNGWTALHYAIDKESKTAVKKLITLRDVDIDIKNNDNRTAFQLASEWEDIPSDLFKLISERSTNETAREKEVSSFPRQLS
jgi:ankyrin repeat protein